MENYADLMFRGQVADLQRAEGTHEKYRTAYRHRTRDTLGEDEIAFIRSRESFYIASLTEDGWPYIQHRGGPQGFVSVKGGTRLICGDYRGNRQFITMGNLATDNRVSLFFMDYLRHARLKLQGRATLVPVADADPEVVAGFSVAGPPPERVLEIEVVAFDWNCPKYIPTLYSEAALHEIVGPEIAKLREENARLEAELEALKNGGYSTQP